MRSAKITDGAESAIAKIIEGLMVDVRNKMPQFMRRKWFIWTCFRVDSVLFVISYSFFVHYQIVIYFIQFEFLLIISSSISSYIHG